MELEGSLGRRRPNKNWVVVVIRVDMRVSGVNREKGDRLGYVEGNQ